MLYIFSNSDDKSIHHIVCTDSDIRAGIIISRIYERERISGEPIRVQFYNDTATTASVYGSAKRYEALKATDESNDTSVLATIDSVARRYEALKRTDKSNNTFEEEISTAPSVDIKYNQFINDIIAIYRTDKRIIALKDFIYNYIDLKGYDAEKVYNDVDSEICRLLTTGFKEETKAKVDALATSNNDVNKASSYSARIDDLAGTYYRHKLNRGMISIIKEVARNNNYDVDKFVKDVVCAHKVAYNDYKANKRKSNSDNNEK